MFSGYKSKNYRLLPYKTVEASFNIFALKAGKCLIPKLQVSKRELGKENGDESVLNEEYYSISGIASGLHHA